MVALTSLLLSAVLATSAAAAPVVHAEATTTKASIVTKLGMAIGVDSGDAYRFTVRYGVAQRWQPATLVTGWSLPNNSSDPSALPLACPQPGLDASKYSEDCLSMIIYVPKSVKIGSNVPTMAWFHGGSFRAGSATGPGLDGSKLAVATNSIVAVIQYRLGALGFLGPNGQTNLGIKDGVVALQFLQKLLSSIGGNSGKVTIAGQSSGGHFVRSLIAAPSAASLFSSAIMQSDPVAYSFFTPAVQAKLDSTFLSKVNCAGSPPSCLNSLSLSSILNAQAELINQASSIDSATSGGEPLRPVRDGSFITSTLDGTAGGFPTNGKPLLLTTVQNEGLYTIYDSINYPVPPGAFELVVSQTYDSKRTSEIVSGSSYALPPDSASGDFDVRPLLDTVGTDANWRCPGWTFARAWAGSGAKAYVGLYTVGATYPGNDEVAACTQNGAVCHQDDIEIVFGTVQNPSSAQVALVKEMQARYANFFRTGNPNAPGYANWNAAGTSDVSAILLGSKGTASVGACTPNYWGSAPQYDYQVYNL